MKSVKIPVYVKKYFWDANIKETDIQKYPEYIIARILEYGDLKSARWLLKIFNSALIKKTLMRRRGFSLKTIYFWKSYFNLDKKKILCLKKSYRKTQGQAWPY